MFKHDWGFAAAFMVLVLIAMACSRTPAGMQANLGQEFSLAIGQSAVVSGEDLGIKFVEVIGDSRCPKKVTCIWAGQASMTVMFTQNDSTYRMALVEPGLGDGPSQETFMQYRISYRLLPYPEEGGKITQDQYRLSLTILK